MTLSEIRKMRYDYTVDYCNFIGIDVNDWKKNPYTWFKSRFYIEFSAILVFLLLRTRIHPNTITLIYALCGLVGGVLLAIPNNITIFLGIFIFFSKGILDWSDGLLARITNRTSVRGAVLDPWGALTNSIGFQVGLGIYVALHASNIIYLYLVIIILALRVADLRYFTCQHFAFEIMHGSYENKTESKVKIQKNAFQTKKDEEKLLTHLMNFIRDFLDDRARSVDFICLLILIELIFPGIFLTWLIIWAFVFKYAAIFLGGLFLTLRRNWIEDTRNSIFK